MIKQQAFQDLSISPNQEMDINLKYMEGRDASFLSFIPKFINFFNIGNIMCFFI